MIRRYLRYIVCAGESHTVRPRCGAARCCGARGPRPGTTPRGPRPAARGRGLPPAALPPPPRRPPLVKYYTHHKT